MVAAAAERAAAPAVEDVEGQRPVRRDRRVKRGGGLPRLEAQARDRLAAGAGRRHRQAPAVAGDHVPAGDIALDLHLKPFDGCVHEAHGSPGGPFFAQHVPGLQRLAQFEAHAALLHPAEDGEAECGLCREGLRVEVVAAGAQVFQHGEEVGPEEMRQHEAIVQGRAPADTAARLRLAPEPRHDRPQQDLLGKAHARVRRHLEGAEFEEAEPPRRSVGREQLVDADLGPVGVAGDVGEDVAEQPVDEPVRDVGLVRARHLGERDLQLVEPVMARLVHARRLARRADIEAGEQVGQARMPLPEQDEALQQVRPAQERRVGGARAAEHDVVAAAGAGMAPVDHELFRAEARLAGLLVEAGGDVDRLAPGGGGVDVDLDHAGIGRDLDDREARIVGGLVALDMDRLADALRGAFQMPDEVEILVHPLQRRHEHAQHAVARLDRQRGAHRHALDAGAVRPVFPLGERCAGLGGQVAAGLHRVLRVVIGVGIRRYVGKRAERQAEAHRRVAGAQVGAAAAEGPGFRDPGAAIVHREIGERQHVADGGVEAAPEHALEPRVGLRAAGLGRRGRDVDRQLALAALPVDRVLVGREDEAGEFEPPGERPDQALGIRDGGGLRTVLHGDQVGVLPDRPAVLAPVQGEGPARQALAGIPLALAVMQHAAGGEAVPKAANQRVGEAPLGRADRGDVPFGRFEVVDRDEGRLAAHGQAHVLRGEIRVDALAEPVHRRPDLVRERLGDARGFSHAADRHLVGELDLGRFGEPRDRRGGVVVGGGHQRDVALAGEQAGGGIETDPAGARQVDLGPGVEIGEVGAGAGRPVDGGGVGHELDQVA